MLCLVFRFGAPTCVLDFRVPPLHFKVQSATLARSFWTFSCLSSASRSNPPIFLAPFGLPRASPPLQGPILLSFSLFLDFLLPPLLLKVQSATLSRSFWTSSCLLSTSKSNPPLFLTPFGLPRISPLSQSPICSSFLTPFGLPRASPPPQSPIHSHFSLLLDFLLHSSASKSNPPLFLTPFGLPRASPPPQGPFRHAPAPHHAKKADCKAIRQSQSTSPDLHQPIPPSKAPAISATSESGTRTYLPSGTNHFPIGLSAPALTASTANFFPATQKNIIAASIAPSGQI